MPIQTWKGSSRSRITPGTTRARLLSTAGAWGEIQIVWTAENLVIDVQARNYGTAGHLHREHALVNISVQTAVRLRQILGEAIEATLDASVGRNYRIGNIEAGIIKFW